MTFKKKKIFVLFLFVCLIFSSKTVMKQKMQQQKCKFVYCLVEGTMFPFGVYTGKILLQTTPAHLITQLDKSLREASTLDGVLEFRDEHFWTLSFGMLVGSLHVRIRRDADEQLVLAHVWNKLAGLVQHLTVHIFKDDWMRRTTHQLVYSNQHLTPPVQSLPPQQPSQLPLTFSAANYNSMSTTTPLNTGLTYSMVVPPPPPAALLHLNKTTATSVSNSQNIISASTVDNDFVIVNP